jgi:hypothetical protein
MEILYWMVDLQNYLMRYRIGRIYSPQIYFEDLKAITLNIFKNQIFFGEGKIISHTNYENFEKMKGDKSLL